MYWIVNATLQSLTINIVSKKTKERYTLCKCKKKVKK